MVSRTAQTTPMRALRSHLGKAGGLQRSWQHISKFQRSISIMSSPNIIKTVSDLRKWRTDQLKQSKSVGLVPTMGALHQGHLDLVSQSLKDNDSTVVSIFVNPSQFSPTEDLDTYPRTLETDLEKLSDIAGRQPEAPTSSSLTVFIPSVQEMYPSGITLNTDEQVGAFVEVKGLSHQLEGSVRSHFFRGVATVVTKLLNVATPERAYFGQKDAQQSVVITRLARDLLLPTEIKVVPTVREKNGLAMSSRNDYLSQESKNHASIFYSALSAGSNVYKENNGPTSRQDILDAVYGILNPYTENGSDFPIEIEYIALSDKTSLKELENVEPGSGAILSGAIRIPKEEKSDSKIRIIDNIFLR